MGKLPLEICLQIPNLQELGIDRTVSHSLLRRTLEPSRAFSEVPKGWRYRQLLDCAGFERRAPRVFVQGKARVEAALTSFGAKMGWGGQCRGSKGATSKTRASDGW